MQKLLKQIKPFLYEIPKNSVPGMRVPARFYITEKMLSDVSSDRSIEQLVNVSMLPGVVEHVLAMPDMHEGYGFPIGGVAAMELPHGVISPGGVGYDINCGVRLLTSDLTMKDVQPKIRELAAELMRAIPSGTGRGGRIKLKKKEIDDVLIEGSEWCIKKGLGEKEDLSSTEEGGRIKDADPTFVSERAKSRGLSQLGTLGSGNHFLEVQRVEEIFSDETAEEFGLFKDQIVISIHCGSRGFGHQVCTDYVRLMLGKLHEYGITLPDPELACAPADSKEGREYISAMNCAANYAWANRQVITHHVRIEWNAIFSDKHPLKMLYDVSHNMAKKETHTVRGKKKKLLVHRKGATRAFPGQPVMIPGTMGTASYVLVGTEEAMNQSFGTVCHGAGRRLSRKAAKKEVSGEVLKEQLEKKGIVIQSFSTRGLAEEAPLAYKDVEDVVGVVEQAGLSMRVARLKPVAVIKGE